LSQKALVLKIEFFEAHFKVHYTKGFRLTYPIPLPTSVAGIFAGLLGIDREDALERFQGCRFGAILADGTANETIENTTFIQHGKNIRGVAKTHVLVDPTYFLAMQAENVKDIKDIIDQGIEYAPFGGQNDFFAKDWNIVDILDVRSQNRIGNYLHAKNVESMAKNVLVEILPVMHRMGRGEDFYFIINGHLVSKKKMPVCSVGEKKICLYSLDDFYTVGEWKNNQ
jgi:CRISPR-associated protein Cas5 subtype I-B